MAASAASAAGRRAPVSWRRELERRIESHLVEKIAGLRNECRAGVLFEELRQRGSGFPVPAALDEPAASLEEEASTCTN